mgnify:CR=1 FL=1
MSDIILRGQSTDGTIKVFVAVTTDLVNEAQKIHNSFPVATAALGRTLTIAAIMIISKRAEAAERRERNKSKIQQLEIPEFMNNGRKDQAAGLRMIISQEGDIVK